MKKIIKSICFSLLAFMFAIGSIFLSIGQQNQKYANADNINVEYSFTASDMYHFDMFYSADAFSSTIPVLFSCNFRSNLDEFTINPYFNYIGTSGIDLTYYSCDFVKDLTSNQIYTNIHSNFISLNPGSTYLLFSRLQSDLTSNHGFRVYFDLDENFSANVYKISLYLNDSYSNYQFLNLTYYDLEEDEFTIRFIVPNELLFNSRTYYILNPDNISNNQYYLQGLETGKAEGFDTGYNNGYRDGSVVGYDNGFEEGKLEGVLQANNYSFFGLISAVIDAPVKILTSLFNFNFLGVNLWAFFTSILTISLIIFVIRKFMAKG